MGRGRRKDGRGAVKAVRGFLERSKRQFSAIMSMMDQPQDDSVFKQKKDGTMFAAAGSDPSAFQTSGAAQAARSTFNYLSTNVQRASNWFATLRPPAPTAPQDDGRFQKSWQPSYVPGRAPDQRLQFDPMGEILKQREHVYASGIAPGKNLGGMYDAWVRKLSGPEGGKHRDFSELTRNIGGRILQMGPNVPAEIRAKASIAQSGTTNSKVKDAELLEEFRGYLGIEQGGGTALKSATNMMRGAVQKGFRLAQIASLANQGGAVGMAATAQLGMDALDQGEKIIHSKLAEKLAETVTDKLFADPAMGVKLVHYLGRAARLGGAVATAAYLVHGFITGRVDSQYNSDLVQAGMAGTKRDFGSWDTGEDIVKQSRKDYDAQKGIYGRTMDALGFTQGTEQAVAQMATTEMGNRVALRATPSLLGTDIAATMAQHAKELGVSVQDLSPEQRDEAIDVANARKLKEIENLPEVKNMAVINSSNFDVLGKVIPYIGQQAYKAQYHQNLIKATNDFINGTGDFQNFAASPAVNQKNVQHNYDLYLQRKDPQLKLELRLDLEAIAMNDLAKRSRRKVQRFD